MEGILFSLLILLVIIIIVGIYTYRLASMVAIISERLERNNGVAPHSTDSNISDNSIAVRIKNKGNVYNPSKDLDFVMKGKLIDPFD